MTINLEEEEEEGEQGLPAESTVVGRKRRRTLQEISSDWQKHWEETMDKRKFKNERQVDAEALGDEHRGLRYIDIKGLNFWTEKLPGYNKKLVIEFYKNMHVPKGEWEANPDHLITSRVGGKDFVTNT